MCAQLKILWSKHPLCTVASFCIHKVGFNGLLDLFECLLHCIINACNRSANISNQPVPYNVLR